MLQHRPNCNYQLDKTKLFFFLKKKKNGKREKGNILPPNAIPGPKTKRLKDIFIIIDESRISKKPFWDEGLWVCEVPF